MQYINNNDNNMSFYNNQNVIIFETLFIFLEIINSYISFLAFLILHIDDVLLIYTDLTLSVLK